MLLQTTSNATPKDMRGLLTPLMAACITCLLPGSRRPSTSVASRALTNHHGLPHRVLH